MNALELAAEAKRLIETVPWESIYDREESRGIYLGSVFTLDPCGSYHPKIDGHPERCERFWAELERGLAELDLSLETGEGDACDKYATEYRTARDNEGSR